MAEDFKNSRDLSGSSIGRFHVLERLGSGGMGEVYLAEDQQLRRTVAIKRMALRLGDDERQRQRFLREAQMASRLNDPHIAAIYDVFERDGEIFLVMERVEGTTLRQKLGQPMAVEEFLPLARQCAEGLAVAHGQGVIHRDIKPDNIMATPSGVVKILDFGLARHLAPSSETVAFETEPGTLSGTVGYIAPEVLLEGEADARADVFSLGVVFYEALTGNHPFRARTPMATSNRVLYEDPAPPSSVNPAIPAPLDHLLARMLAKRPFDRYASAAEVAAELNWIERGGTAPTMPAIPTVKAGPRKRQRPWWIAGAAVVAGLALMAAIPQVRHTVAGWLGRGARTGTAAQGERQLAVLPFTARGGTEAQKAFAAGLTDTVTARLTELSANHALAVVPASEIYARKVDSPDMARRMFGVNLVLTGGLQEAGGEIRVTYALVNAQTQRQVAAQTKTVAAANPFAVEDDVSAGVLGMLQLQLQPSERKTLEAKGTDKPGAYAFYLQGMGYLDNYEQTENIASAISVFEHALTIDPKYARAYAGLGQAYWQRYNLTQEAKWTKLSRQACNKAIRIDAGLAAAHVCLGTVASGTGNYADAVRQFQRALAAEPTSDLAYKGLAGAYGQLGRTAEAEETFKKAIALRPQYWAGYNWLGIFYYEHGRYTEAETMFRHVVALVPESFTGYSNLGGIYAQMGDFAKAVPQLEHSIRIRPNNSAYSNLGTAQFFLHRYSEAVTNFQKAVELLPTSYINWRNLGDGYYWASGQHERAATAYRKSIELAQAALKVNPQDPTAYEILAICQAMLGENGPAVASVGKAVKLAPGDPDKSYAAALVYTRTGNRERGIEWLKLALKEGASAAMVRNDPAFDALRDMKDYPKSLRDPQSTP